MQIFYLLMAKSSFKIEEGKKILRNHFPINSLNCHQIASSNLKLRSTHAQWKFLANFYFQVNFVQNSPNTSFTIILKLKKVPEPQAWVVFSHFEIIGRRGDLGKSSFTSQNEPKVGNLPDASAPSEAIKNRFPVLWWLLRQLFKLKIQQIGKIAINLEMHPFRAFQLIFQFLGLSLRFEFYQNWRFKYFLNILWYRRYSMHSVNAWI